jgi:NADH dehydrogenase [ubiquinone] 1 alpha subcomplex assembly factor 7
MFGELIGLWCAHTWAAMGSPERVNLVELGPGRGTLMRDALRAAAMLPPFREALRVHMVETSPVLRTRQGETLAPALQAENRSGTTASPPCPTARCW